MGTTVTVRSSKLGQPRAATAAGVAVSVVAASLLAVLLIPGAAWGQATTGSITGRVSDQATGGPLGGVTVIAQGQQGEDATLTDDNGLYTFATLPVGKYTVRFYTANVAIKVEVPDINVTAAATLRADAVVPSQAAVEETTVIRKRAPAIDVGSTRTGMTVGEDYLTNVPNERTFGDVIEKAPGAFLESSGGVSIAGASGLENVYNLDGMNVTGMEYGDIMNRRSDASGGSNLTLDFIKELQVNTGGYRAEFGGAMGGVINVITKSGSNEWHGSVFSYWSPYWMAADPKRLLRSNVALVGTEKPDYDTNIGLEVGGPIIRNKLFIWAGFAPRFEKSHFFRDTLALSDVNDDGAADIDPATGEARRTLVHRVRTNQSRNSYQLGTKIDYLVLPDHRLSVGFFRTPNTTRHVRNLNGFEAVNDPAWALQGLQKTNTDVIANWVSEFYGKKLRVELNTGIHSEGYSDKSPYANLNTINQIEWHSARLFDIEGLPGCAPSASGFDPCPVDVYRTGGYGQVKEYSATRVMGELKLTRVFRKFEIKVGARGERNDFDQTRYYSGPLGGRALVQHYPMGGQVVPVESQIWNFFSLPRGTYPFQFFDNNPANGTDADLSARYYQDQLVASVKSTNIAYFAQGTARPLPNVAVDAGLRLEQQKLYDYRGDQFLDLSNFGPRLGVVYDPSNQGRSKIYAHYGRFYETIPLNLAARYFGGEGIIARYYDASTCAVPQGQWTGSGSEWNGCSLLGTQPLNAGAPYPVQPNIKPQSHDEIVTGFRHALTEDLVVGMDYTYRKLNSIIEDGTAAPDFAFVLGNPGDVPTSVLQGLDRDIEAKMSQIAGAANEMDRAVFENELGQLQSKRANLEGLAKAPKPQRTYNALSVVASKRLAKRWMFQGSYTYSRLVGNYNGLFDADFNYAAPNGGNAYDTPELSLNRRGPLANDRPHSARVEGYYQHEIGRGTITAGLSFSAFSGVPINYVSALIPGQQLIFLLPRGAGGRTPTVMQTDFKLAYRRQVSKATAVEVFFDLFNIFNSRTALRVDENYTFEMAAPIVNGTAADLPYARNVGGLPISVNPNWGKPTAFQLPFHGRMGLRFLF